MDLKIATILFLGLSCTLASSEDKPADQPGNLRLTFDTEADVPAAFKAEEFRNEPRRIIFKACQDGSGGVCVPSGQCPAEFRPDSGRRSRRPPCPQGNECCYKIPSKDCKEQGGECMSRSDCGKAPQLADAEGCQGSNDQVCCILL